MGLIRSDVKEGEEEERNLAHEALEGLHVWSPFDWKFPGPKPMDLMRSNSEEGAREIHLGPFEAQL